MSTTDEQDQGVWLTQEAHDRLKGELDGLIAGRTAMAAEINARREEGDLKENGGYHAAKEEQGKQEGRIRQLTQLLRDATVGAAPADDGVVEPGMVVVAEVNGTERRFLFGSREVAEGTDLEVYSPTSPLGGAINGRSAGDETRHPPSDPRNEPTKLAIRT